jgi:hypothetical protein
LKKGEKKVKRKNRVQEEESQDEKKERNKVEKY